jgi:ADP-ribose pyrophosphatase YjhB (NUDIX family)
MAFIRKTPRGDTHERDVCNDCGFIRYDNPKVVVGSVVTYEGRILLCKRAIPPRVGLWTLPAGYLELQERPEDGAKREALEEACAEIEIEQLLAVYSITHISQLHLMFRAALINPSIEAGTESLEVRLFEWNEIPWQEIAFPSVHWALAQYRETASQEVFTVFGNPPGETGFMPEDERKR